MWRFAVWAPRAGTLAVRQGARHYQMIPGNGDWWRVDVAEACAGTDYSLVVNDGEPVPDPRSAFQPYGVHGASRTVDHGAFAWNDGDWQAGPLRSAIVYELHIGTFTGEGTFDGAIARLDYLKELGVTHVELMPVNEFPGSWGWGYDGVDLFAPHHVYGGPDAMKRLVNACHMRGLAVILDVVYNHLGPSGNYLSRFGPYFTDRYSTPWGEAVNLDGEGSAEVRRFFRDNALMWLRDYHVDALRLDAVHAFIDRSAVHFLEELGSAVRELTAATGRHKFLIAESDGNDPRLVRSQEAGGYGLDAQWSDDFHHALHAVLTGDRAGYYEDFGSVEQIAKALRETFVYDGCYAKHRGRNHGRSAADVSSHRFLGYLQTHDQVGNRARGERVAHLTGIGKAKIGAALVFTSPFIPMIFQGEEFAASSPFQYFTDHQEEGLAQAVSEGRRREFAAFGWKPEEVPDPQDPETFRRSKLNWSEAETEPHREMLEWYRGLIRLRRALPELNGERRDLAVEHGEDWIAVKRGGVLVACNLAETVQWIPAPGEWRVALTSGAPVRVEAGRLEAPPQSATVLTAQQAR